MSTLPLDPSTPVNAEAAMQGTALDAKHETLTRPYAEALVNTLAAEGDTDAALAELGEIVAATERSPVFRAMVESPAVSRDEQDRVLVKLFEKSARPTLLKFLRVLNRAGRLELLGSISRQATRVWDARQNRKAVTVVSAVALNDSQRAELRTSLQKSLRAEPILQERVDPAILGGLVIQVGDEVFDTSVRSQLERLRRRLVDDQIQQIRGELATRAITE